MKPYFQDKTLSLSSNQDLILTVWRWFEFLTCIPYFNTPLTRKQARWHHLFIAFFNVHIVNVNHAKFHKKFDSRTISRELPSMTSFIDQMKLEPRPAWSLLEVLFKFSLQTSPTFSCDSPRCSYPPSCAQAIPGLDDRIHCIKLM